MVPNRGGHDYIFGIFHLKRQLGLFARAANYNFTVYSSIGRYTAGTAIIPFYCLPLLR